VSTTTETLKHGTELVADTAAHAAAEIAERAKKQAEAFVQVAEQAAERLAPTRKQPRRRGRKLLGATVALAAAGWVAKWGRKMLQDRRQQQQVIDLTLGPRSDGASPQSADTGVVTGTAP
jgi:ferric-dicitrate binding protein FerR (iron transport regulator)